MFSSLSESVIQNQLISNAQLTPVDVSLESSPLTEPSDSMIT